MEGYFEIVCIKKKKKSNSEATSRTWLLNCCAYIHHLIIASADDHLDIELIILMQNLIVQTPADGSANISQ